MMKLLNESLQLYHDLFAVNRRILELVARNRETVLTGVFSLEDMTDLAFIMRESAAMSNDMRKTFEDFQRFLVKIICVAWTSMSMNGVQTETLIRGRLCVGSPDIAVRAKIPRKGTDEWRILLKSVGIPDGVIDNKMVEVHWPTFQQWLRDLQEAGKPLPGGIDPNATWTESVLTMRKSQDLIGLKELA